MLLVEPDEGVGVDHVDPRVAERIVVQRREHGMLGEQVRHLRIEVDQRDAFEVRVFEQFAHGQAVAAAQHQRAARAGQRRQAGMHQRFVIAVFVARAELQMRVQEQAQVVFPFGDDDALVARLALKDHFVGVELVVGLQIEIQLDANIPPPSSASTTTQPARSSDARRAARSAKQKRRPERDARR